MRYCASDGLFKKNQRRFRTHDVICGQTYPMGWVGARAGPSLHNSRQKSNMNQFFKELYEYNYQMNQKLFDVMVNHPDRRSEKAEQLFNHLLNAHQIWNNRIDFKQPTFGVWERHAFQDLKGIDQVNFEHTVQMLDRVDLDERINYLNSSGQPFRNRIRDLLFHVINHSSYHRGQIATEFRRQGLEPLVTDFIVYKR